MFLLKKGADSLIKDLLLTLLTALGVGLAVAIFSAFLMLVVTPSVADPQTISTPITRTMQACGDIAKLQECP